MAALPTSNFPAGFSQGVTIRGMPIAQTHPGKVFWVSNATTLLKGQRGGSNGNDGTFNSPFPRWTTPLVNAPPIAAMSS